MIIDLALIGEGEKEFVCRESAVILDLHEEEGIRVTDDISCCFYAQISAKNLIVRGKWSTILELECCRCGEFFSTTLQDSSFLRDYAISAETFHVDITDDIRESVLLKLPNFPVCRKDCKGRCTQCGANLNKDKCECHIPEEPGAWEALDGLNLE